MAATHTTNLNLNKPARTDFVSVVSDINDNMDTIDQRMGSVPVNKSVQGQIDQLDTDVGNKIDKVTGHTEGHFASLNAEGAVVDSGYDSNDFVPSSSIASVAETQAMIDDYYGG